MNCLHIILLSFLKTFHFISRTRRKYQRSEIGINPIPTIQIVQTVLLSEKTHTTIKKCQFSSNKCILFSSRDVSNWTNMSQKISISNKSCSIEGKIENVHGFHKNIKQHNSFQHLFLEQQISMISEVSCYTKDWSNDAENSALEKLF